MSILWNKHSTQILLAQNKLQHLKAWREDPGEWNAK